MEPMEQLLAFLDQLRSSGVRFNLAHTRAAAIMVEVHIPRERREVEFFADGSIEVDRYQGHEGVLGSDHLGTLWRLIEGDDDQSRPG